MIIKLLCIHIKITGHLRIIYIFSSVQSLSRVQLFVTPWISAHQASLSITNSQSSLKLTSIKSVMPSSHLILYLPLLLLPPIPPGKQLTHWKSPWCWERLRAGGGEHVRGWECRMTSPMQWTWTWSNFGRWWGTERPGMLQSVGSQESDMTGQLNNNNNNKSWLPSPSPKW